MNATPAADTQGAKEAEVRTGGCLCGRIRFTAQGPAVFPTPVNVIIARNSAAPP